MTFTLANHMRKVMDALKSILLFLNIFYVLLPQAEVRVFVFKISIIATITNTKKITFKSHSNIWHNKLTLFAHSFVHKAVNGLWFYDKFIRLADFNCYTITITITITLALCASIVQSILLTSNCNQNARDIRSEWALMSMCDDNDCL